MITQLKTKYNINFEDLEPSERYPDSKLRFILKKGKGIHYISYIYSKLTGEWFTDEISAGIAENKLILENKYHNLIH